MATIVNNPGNTDGGAAVGLATAVIVVVALGLIAFFVWPGFGTGGAGTTNTVNVEVPALDAGGEGASGGGTTY